MLYNRLTMDVKEDLTSVLYPTRNKLIIGKHFEIKF